MYLHKQISVNNEVVVKFPFQREIVMEAYLIENPTVLSMETDGFNEVDILKYEVTLLDGRVDCSTDGRIDILAKYGQEYLAIVELKLGELTEKHLIQLESYLEERQQILQKFPKIWDTAVGSQPKWIGIMVGETINPDLMLKIRRGYYLADTDIPIAALTINRYKGEDGNIYVITDTYFVERVKNRDYTKYIFKGQKYGKNRLVLTVIKDFVENNPTTNYRELERKFPQSLQSRETFTTEIKAKQKSDRRNFIEPDELITLADETIAISTQWGLTNIKAFIEHCKSMNIEINITNE